MVKSKKMRICVAALAAVMAFAMANVATAYDGSKTNSSLHQQFLVEDGFRINKFINGMDLLSKERRPIKKDNGRCYANISGNRKIFLKGLGTLMEVETPEGKNYKVGIEPEMDGNENISNINNLIVSRDVENDCLTMTDIFNEGVRNIFVVGAGCKKDLFSINFRLPVGAHIKYSVDLLNENKQDGSLEILDKDNNLIGAIASPYAKDASGKSLETYYKVEGHTVRQYVNHLKKGHAITYPITVAPMSTFNVYFDSGKWITRGKLLSLSLNPTKFLRVAMFQGSSAVRKSSWKTVYYKFHKDKRWRRTESMQMQYDCHWHFAKLKDKFNLEPSRPNVSWFDMIRAKCNP
ncbi:hypothetical protein AXF21_04235 [Eubacterium minutum ATCC 700079]|nr:hypothetical protein AXF21_04235 [Eubacterium minutum ATCC 700079]